jgi:hypothetical protein
MLALLIGAIGGVGYGWRAREHTADHRYITALAERHEAESSYYMKKLDEEIQQNKGRLARREENGK